MNDTWKQVPVTLSRGLNLLDVTMIGVGAMIGAGIFGLTGIAAGKAGPVGLLIAFFLNGVVTLMTGLSYAELGAAIPTAGGGYSFVREGLSRFWGFTAGWISWFSNSVACSLYAVIFGAFFIEMLDLFGLHFTQNLLLFNLNGVQWAEKLVSVLIIVVFIIINTRGASETGTVGNVITSFKIVVLMSLVVAGLSVIFGENSNWQTNFSNPVPNPGKYPGGPLPNGILGIFLAMGLTYVAFEGYEIIAQSGEELVEPEKNLPRAIFYSIAITVAIYLLVAFVSVGALFQESGLPNWIYLGQEGEKAMIRTAESILPWGIGALIMILGGLASTTSALNATIYSSSRVSFAMGRGKDLPKIFGRIHHRNRTPDIAIYTSGALIILFAVLLPIQDVASGASLTFLLLFLLVNVALLQLRKTRPDLERPFRVPLVPFLPILAILIQAGLALVLFNVSWIAWAAVAVWFLLGIVVYQYIRKRQVEALKADTILLEETIAKRTFSLMLPVALPAQARQLARLAAGIARYNEGEIFALHVVRVPPQVGLGDGRTFLKQARPLLEEVINVGKEYEVPVRTQLRLGRNISQSIMTVARERDVELILLGWPGTTDSAGSVFGSIVELVSANPPADLAVVRLVRIVTPRRILVPVIRNRNSRLALRLALSQVGFAASLSDEEVKVTALHLVSTEMNGKAIEVRRSKLVEELRLDTSQVELEILPCHNVVNDILTQSEEYDEIVIGAPEERLLQQQLFGSVAQKVAENAQVNVIVVKRHDPIIHGLVNRWVGRIPVKINYGQD